MPEELRALLDRLAGGEGVEPLTDEELSTLRDGLSDYAVELHGAGVTAETVEQLSDIAESVDAVTRLQDERRTESERLELAAREALTRIRPHEENRREQEQPEGQPAEQERRDDDQNQAQEGSPAAADEAAERQEPAQTSAQDVRQAAIRRTANMAAQRRPAQAPRQPQNDGRPRGLARLTTAGRFQGLNPGDPIADVSTLGRIMAQRLQAMGPHGGTVLVASQFTEYPESRQLSPDDASLNQAKIEAVTSRQSLVASGGICEPVAIDYSVPTFSVADRPIEAGLPTFGASRGGIRYLTPPRMSDVTGATGIWTHQNDANPTSPTTKPILKIACASEVEVLVDAVVSRLEVGNMQGRFSPEIVAANMSLSTAWHARVSELNLLNQILAASTEVTFAGSGLGATPELLASLELALANMRYFDRLSTGTRLRVIFPQWVREIIRSDMARRLATDSAQDNGGSLNVTDAQMDAWFAARSVTVTWSLDGIAAQATGATYPLQGFAAQAAGALNTYPAKLVYPIYPEGTFQHLDGGQLDLGVVRDSTLDATNDYEVFMEEFTAVAKRGITSYKVVVPLVPTGATAGTQDTSAYAGG
jgi:hypothetical protein